MLTILFLSNIFSHVSNGLKTQQLRRELWHPEYYILLCCNMTNNVWIRCFFPLHCGSSFIKMLPYMACSKRQKSPHGYHMFPVLLPCELSPNWQHFHNYGESRKWRTPIMHLFFLPCILVTENNTFIKAYFTVWLYCEKLALTVGKWVHYEVKCRKILLQHNAKNAVLYK